MAEAYFEIFDDNGKLIVDLATQPMQYVTQISTGKSNGSHTISLSSGQSVIASYPHFSGVPSPGTQSPIPSISVSGNKISWSFDNSGASTNWDATITVFVYG